MRGLVLGTALVLAGCATTAPAPVNVNTVRVVERTGNAVPLARGETQLVVRAVPAGTSGQELRGAACTAEAPWFQADFASPGLLLMPDYGSAAPDVTVTCRSGTASGTGIAHPQSALSGGMGGWPAIGVSVGTGNSSGVGVGFGWFGGGGAATGGVPVTRYPELQVVMQ